MLSYRCTSVCPVLSVCLSLCNVGVLWPNDWMGQDETGQAGRPWRWPHCVRWGPSSPPQKGAEPQFSADVCYDQIATLGLIKMPLGTEVGLDLSDFVLDGDPAPPPQKGGRAPKFLAHVYCISQTARWIEMAHSIEVGLGSGHIVLDEDPATLPKKGQIPPIFGPFLLWPNCWMHQDATWYGGRPQPRRLCVRWGPSSPPLPCVLWPKGCMYQDTTWYGGGVSLGDIVLNRDPAPPLIFGQCPL